MLIKAENADHQGNDELRTNTTYEFIGLQGTNVNGTSLPTSDGKVLTGFTVPSCTTSKAPALFEAKSNGTSNAIYTNDRWDLTGSINNQVNDSIYSTELTGKHYRDTKTYKFNDGKDVIPSGTSIKFPNIVLKDSDDSIVRIEIEDSYGKKYPGHLIYKNSKNKDEGQCIQITGLKSETIYTFTNLHITTKTGGSEQTKTIAFREKDTSTTNPNSQIVTTTSFKEPVIELGSTKGDDQITLPGKVKVPAVKNDMTALRYILKVDNSNGNIGDMRVNGLKGSESYNVDKILDKDNNVNYYVLTLTNLEFNTDYGFLTLELDYKDFENKSGMIRTSLSSINSKSTNSLNDNTTEKTPLPDKDAFVIDVVSELDADYGRSAMIPVFIDDMNGMLKDVKILPTPSTSDMTLERRGSTLYVRGLKPNATETLALSFIYQTRDGREDSVKKYVIVKTPQIEDIDIKNDTVTVSGNEVNIKLDYYSSPKSSVKSIVVKDENGNEINSSWNGDVNTITLKGLETNKTYRGLVVIFTLDNTNVVSYPLSPFVTTQDNNEEKPTEKVAEFVKSVYTIALGREPEVTGWNFWINKLQSKELSATEFIAENLMTQKEFVERELNKEAFVTTMYSLIVSRKPDMEGQFYWEKKYEAYSASATSIAELRIKIAREMMNEQEFKDLITSLGLRY